VDLGIGQPGVVIDGGVDEAMADQRVVMAAALAAGAVSLAVALSAGPAQEPVAARGRDPAQLLDIDVDQLTGMGVLVAADRLAGGPVQIPQAGSTPLRATRPAPTTLGSTARASSAASPGQYS
jgi:hypothetical protein